MSTQAMQKTETKPTTMLGKLVTKGDLSLMTPAEQFQYYLKICERYHLDPLTKPFDLIRFKDEKLVLYANRSCTDQLRAINGVSITITSRESIDSVFIVTAQAKLPDGRCDESVGAVPLVKEGGSWSKNESGKSFFKKDGTFIPLSPEEKSNATMKAETKAKRRVTLSICGLAVLDEAETESIPGAQKIEMKVDQETGEVSEIDMPNPFEKK